MQFGVRKYLPRCRLAHVLAVAVAVVQGSTVGLAQRDVPTFKIHGTPESVGAADTNSGGASQRSPPRGHAKLIPPVRPGAGHPDNDGLDSAGPAGSEAPSQWLATVDMTDRVGCTGTLIGPRVLLTAAHCLERWPVIGLAVAEVAARLRVIQADCQLHPSYRPTGHFSMFDYALCHLREPFPAKLLTKDETDPDGSIGLREVRFERLSTDPRRVRLRAPILLAGYGCSTKTSEVIDGKLRAGIAIVRRASPIVLAVGGKFGVASAVLCVGDSGGAAFAYEDGQPYGRRVIVGVNSASIQRRDTSYLARTSSIPFRRFLRNWRARWRFPKICGQDRDIEHRCRNKSDDAADVQSRP